VGGDLIAGVVEQRDQMAGRLTASSVMEGMPSSLSSSSERSSANRNWTQAMSTPPSSIRPPA
jgi:hypothetical protein